MIRPANVALVFRRHVREIVRERRTMLGLFLVPVLTIVIFSIAREEIASEVSGRAAKPPKVAVTAGDEGASLVAFLGRRGLDPVPAADVRAAVRAKVARVGLEIPAGFDRAVARGRRASVRLVVSERGLRTEVPRSALEAALEAFGRDVLRRRIRAAGLPPTLAEPVDVRLVDLATRSERSGSVLAQILPFLIVAQVVGLMGALAVDATAGEKERRTIEALLATPLSRREILTGKWLVTYAFGLVATVITTAAGLLSFRYAASSLGADALAVPASSVAGALAGAAVLAAGVGAIQMTIGVFARSMQQASVFVAPVTIAIFLPAIFLQTGFADSAATTLYAVPLLGPMLLMRNALAGRASGGATATTIVTGFLVAAVVLGLADRLFRSERTLLRLGG